MIKIARLLFCIWFPLSCFIPKFSFFMKFPFFLSEKKNALSLRETVTQRTIFFGVPHHAYLFVCFVGLFFFPSECFADLKVCQFLFEKIATFNFILRAH